MRKFFSLLACVALLFATFSCSKSDESISIGFKKAINVMLADAPIEIELQASAAFETATSIPVNVAGSAVLNDEYTMSSKNFEFAAGSSVAKITFTPLNNLAANKEISLSLGNLPAGYVLGNITSTIITLEKKEHIIFSFNIDKADLLDKYKLSLTLSGETSGKNFTTTSDLVIPIKFASSSTAVEGTDFEIEGGVKAITVKAGTNVGFVMLKAKGVEFGKEKKLVVEVDKASLGNRFLQGDIPSISIQVKGIFKLSSIVGKWTFKSVPEVNELLTWVEEMEDDPALVPVKNSGFTFEIKETDGVYTLVPGSVKGDLSAYLREATISYGNIVNPIKKSTVLGTNCTEEPFMWTSERIQLTYFNLSKVNRAFSASKETLGNAAIALRFNSDGQLELHLRDYNKPPFMENWWNDNFDTDMFGFCYIFTK